MRILIALANVRRGDPASAHRFRDVIQIGRARYDPQLRIRWCREQHDAGDRCQYEFQSFEHL
jgi:hypothetical protein